MSVNFQLVDLLLVSPAIALFIASLIPLSVKAFGRGRTSKSMSSVLYGLIGLTIAGGLTISNYGINQTAFSKSLVFDGIGS
jgi:NADH-quinone oxidoreductase subunit N